MTETQHDRYKQLVQSFSSESGILRATFEISGMTMMMDMRKLANHPLLLRYYYTDDDVMKMAVRLSTDVLYKRDNPNHIFQDLAILSDFQLFTLCKKYPVCNNQYILFF